MKKFIKFIVVVMLISPLVFAVETKTFDWTPPVQNTDGTPLPDAEIASYNIFCNAVLLGNVPNTGGTDSWLSPPLPVGAYNCHATTVAINGEESAASNSVNFTVDPSKPEAPSNFSVTLP
jgi:hypothetical protein